MISGLFPKKRLHHLCLAAASAALLAASGQALASDHTKFDGPYVGAHGAYSFGEVRSKGSSSFEDVSVDSFGGGVHAGYGRAFVPRIYTGVEIDHNWSFADGQGRDAKYEMVRDYGAALRVGYVADEDTLIYGRVGYQRAAIKMNEDREWRGGVKAGAGIEHLVLDDVSVRGEYTYAHYFANKGRDSFKDAADSSLSVGVAYHF